MNWTVISLVPHRCDTIESLAGDCGKTNAFFPAARFDVNQRYFSRLLKLHLAKGAFQCVLFFSQTRRNFRWQGGSSCHILQQPILRAHVSTSTITELSSSLQTLLITDVLRRAAFRAICHCASNHPMLVSQSIDHSFLGQLYWQLKRP